MSRWTKHRDRWKSCELCELCKGRKRVVLLRGVLPCDILFIGEAPGVGEDTLGKPFVGPAGKLLDRMIEDSIPTTFRLAFTNLIACIPLDEEGNKTKEPDKKYIRACSDRLREIYSIAKPRVVVMVGKLAEKWVPQLITELTMQRVGIIHPAAILRGDISQRGLAIQQTKVRLQGIVEGIIPF